MKRILRNLSVLWATIAVWSCGSESGDSGTTCVPGQSIACVGPSGCKGAQVCTSDAATYGPCACGAVPGGSGSSSNGSGSSSGNGAGSGSGARQSGAGGTGLNGFGGTGPNPGFGGTGQSGGQGPNGGSRSCTPENMSGYGYPAYKPARRLGGSCTEQAAQQYYTACYSNGDCAAFQPGGAQAACGACLAPSSLGAAQYGPLIKLGTDTQYLAQTNVAGCIELMGEPDCAPYMQVAALCEYFACAAGCPITDSASYQAEMNCMTQARGTVCLAAQAAAVCIRDPAHVTACSSSGSGFEGQFLAVARVFCVESH